MADRKEELYQELQMLDAQIKQVQEHLERLDSQLAELISVGSILDDISTVKPGDEALVPISNGIYIKTEIKDAENLLVNVGANSVVGKSIPQVRKMISDQEKEIRGYRERILQGFQTLIKRVEEIQTEAESQAQ